MDIWLDDERNPKDFGAKGFTWFTDGQALISWLQEHGMEGIGTLSLDHDLGIGCITGYDVIVWIESQVAEGKMPPTRISIHTQNPIGKDRMMAARKSIYAMAKNRIGE